MKPIRLILALCSLAVAAAASAQPDTRFNRAPLQPRPYAELPIGAQSLMKGDPVIPTEVTVL